MSNSHLRRLFGAFALSALAIPACAQPAAPPAAAPEPPGVLVVEAEDFKPSGATGANAWRTVFNGQGNYMVDIIGFQHISGERVLSGPARSVDARATTTVQIPKAGTYRIWSRFEQPTNTENRFRVEVRQNGAIVGQAVMGEKNAPKYFFGSKTPVAQADPSWGSEGLVEQGFDVPNLSAGPAEISLVTVDQPAPSANRNVDFLYMTQDLNDDWRLKSGNTMYPILDAELAALPPRYYLRLTSPVAGTVGMRSILNRSPWYLGGGEVALQANTPSAWIPLTNQDVTHYATWSIGGANLNVRADFASAPNERSIIRTINWNDPKRGEMLVGLPPYPNKYAGEKIITVDEQYRSIANYLKANPSKVGRDPRLPLAWGGINGLQQHGRLGDAAADVYFGVGMRTFLGFVGYNSDLSEAIASSNAQFAARGLKPMGRSIALGAYRLPPTPENIAAARATADKFKILGQVQRFDYGDEIGFSEWLNGLTAEQLAAGFKAWQQKKHGKVLYQTPDSTTEAATRDPMLYADSQDFYEEAAIEHVATLAREIPRQFGPQVVYGANVGAHPFYYPEIAKYIKWFRPTANGGYAATFGRHSEYFWQIGQPGPLVNGYIADFFTSGMRDNPQAVLQQYTMPHSPGNTNASFRRSAFTHLAHGARALDYFGMGVNSSFTENYIDFRDVERYAAIRDINRSMATIEDILPQSRPVRTRVAMIISDSTERWDLAGIARDRAGLDVFGATYKQTRLAYHQERVGLYYALIHNSRPPDMLTEEDVQRGVLKNYAVAYWTGDCAMPQTVTALRGWVEGGGHLVATAGAMRFDQYKRPVTEGNALLGLQTATLEERERFFRPQIELPRLQPIDSIGQMPALAYLDTVTAMPTARVTRTFKSGAPAVVENTVGRGKTTFIATLPGVAYLWSAYQPAADAEPMIPSRGPSSHMELDFNRATGSFIAGPARAIPGFVEAGNARIDARLLQAPAGYAVVLSNYQTNVKAPVTLTIRGVPGARTVSSAVAGRLKTKRNADGSLTVNYAPGYGDILRVER